MNDLTQLRKSKGFTMQTLAKKSGISANTISTYETTPPKRPRKKVMEKIATALDVPTEELSGKLMPGEKPSKASKQGISSDTIELNEIDIARIISLIDQEVLNLHHFVIESSQVEISNPVLVKSLEYFSKEIEALTNLKEKLA